MKTGSSVYRVKVKVYYIEQNKLENFSSKGYDTGLVVHIILFVYMHDCMLSLYEESWECKRLKINTDTRTTVHSEPKPGSEHLQKVRKLTQSRQSYIEKPSK